VDEEAGKIFETLLTRFYLNADFIPPEILVAEEPENKAQITQWTERKAESYGANS